MTNFISNPLTVSEAQAARDAAFAAFENIGAEIKKAEAAIGANSPAKAVATGSSLQDAAKAQAEARHHLEFYQEAKSASWQKVLDAEAALKAAHVRAKWAEKLAEAITARIKACADHEAAAAAAAQAQTDYRSATNIIAEAFAAGMPKPSFLLEHPLHLHSAPDQRPRIRMRPAAEERALWGIEK